MYIWTSRFEDRTFQLFKIKIPSCDGSLNGLLQVQVFHSQGNMVETIREGSSLLIRMKIFLSLHDGAKSRQNRKMIFFFN